MPIQGARYRFRRTKSGKTQRLAFKDNKVVEVTPFKKGSRGKLVKAGPSERIRSIAKSHLGR